jgi:chromosome segregation ATPase
MTSTRYIFLLAVAAFGYRRENMRMTEAAEETRLLKEAESHLGKAMWEKVEGIEALSVEYWNLRKLIKRRDRVIAELESRQQQLTKAHEERVGLLAATDEPFQDQLEERQIVLNSREELEKQRDMIVNEARDIRRAYEGTKTKQEVLTNEGASKEEDFSDIANRLVQLKSEFSVLKAECQKVADKIAEEDAKIDKIDTEIIKHKQERREKASEVFQYIRDTNPKISTLRAELSVLNTQIRQLYTEIGKYVSRNTTDPECRKASKEVQWLVVAISALRKSILLNHKLSGNE